MTTCCKMSLNWAEGAHRPAGRRRSARRSAGLLSPDAISMRAHVCMSDANGRRFHENDVGIHDTDVPAKAQRHVNGITPNEPPHELHLCQQRPHDIGLSKAACRRDRHDVTPQRHVRQRIDPW